jgi:hypothetical protein
MNFLRRAVEGLRKRAIMVADGMIDDPNAKGTTII